MQSSRCQLAAFTIALGMVSAGSTSFCLLGENPARAESTTTTDTAPSARDADGSTQVKIVEFVEQAYPAGRDTDAVDAPTAGAVTVVRLRQNMPVKVVGVVDGNQWLQVELPDKRIAYVPADAIPGAMGASAGAAAAPAATSPASAQAAPSTSASTQTGGSAPTSPDRAESTVPPPQTVEFQDDAETLYAIKRTGVFLDPSRAAPQEYFVDRETAVDVIAKTKDGQWAWVNTADGQPAFIVMTDLSASPPAPDEVSGIAKVIDTGTITIGTRALQLLGVEGLTGIYSKQLQSLIELKGGKLDCHRTEQKYVCDLPGGIDVGKAAIFNGAARLGSDASQEYLRQAEAAKNAGRGIWSQNKPPRAKSGSDQNEFSRRWGVVWNVTIYEVFTRRFDGGASFDGTISDAGIVVFRR